MSTTDLKVALPAHLVRDLEQLAAHMGQLPQEALADAVRDWVGRNAEIFDFCPSPPKETP